MADAYEEVVAEMRADAIKLAFGGMNAGELEDRRLAILRERFVTREELMLEESALEEQIQCSETLYTQLTAAKAEVERLRRTLREIATHIHEDHAEWSDDYFELRTSARQALQETQP